MDLKDLKFYKATHLENLDCNVYFSDVDIVPKYLLSNGVIWLIEVPHIYRIKRLRLLVDEKDRVIKLKIDAPHPNASLYDGDFCLPRNDIPLDKYGYNYFNKMLNMWNIDSCYFVPGDFKYKNQVGERLKSLFSRRK